MHRVPQWTSHQAPRPAQHCTPPTLQYPGCHPRLSQSGLEDLRSAPSTRTLIAQPTLVGVAGLTWHTIQLGAQPGIEAEAGQQRAHDVGQRLRMAFIVREQGDFSIMDQTEFPSMPRSALCPSIRPSQEWAGFGSSTLLLPHRTRSPPCAYRVMLLADHLYVVDVGLGGGGGLLVLQQHAPPLGVGFVQSQLIAHAAQHPLQRLGQMLLLRSAAVHGCGVGLREAEQEGGILADEVLEGLPARCRAGGCGRWGRQVQGEPKPRGGWTIAPRQRGACRLG